jgi:hypothetical protein
MRAEAPDPDLRLCDLIRGGDASVLGDLLARDHAVADLLARAAAHSGVPGDSVARAWELLIGDIIEGTVAGGLRAALLERVIAVLDERALLDTVVVETAPRGPFLPPDDPWAGWWAEDPATWPGENRLTAGIVSRALRQVPVGLRVLLVLRDAAGISAAAAEPIVHRDPHQQGPLLEMAREAYVTALDGELT